ncbi:MAG TPA: hypothetical protein VFK89_03595 [Actinomycetota bacterium]|nr:hypothetical protein [Actinomycetota bacterium]
MAMTTKDLRGIGLVEGSPQTDLSETSGDWLASLEEDKTEAFGPTATDLIESSNALSR